MERHINERDRELFEAYYLNELSKITSNIVESSDRIFNDYCLLNNITDENKIHRYGTGNNTSEREVLSINRIRIHKALKIDHLFKVS